MIVPNAVSQLLEIYPLIFDNSWIVVRYIPPSKAYVIHSCTASDEAYAMADDFRSMAKEDPEFAGEYYCFYCLEGDWVAVNKP